MTSVLLGAALVSLAVGALSGFALLVAVDRPQSLRAVGVVAPKRVRQVHLDWIIMGCVMAVPALAVPGLSTVTATLVLIGGVVNPLTFVPMAFSHRVADTRTFQVVSYLSFFALCGGLVATVVEYIAG